MRANFTGRGGSAAFGLLCLLIALSVPATAAASSTAAKPKAARASVALYLPDAFFVDHQPVTVPGRVIHLGGVVRPWVPGQTVTVRAYLGSRLIKTDHLRVNPSPKHTYGRFTEAFSSPGAGNLAVVVAHKRTSGMLSFLTRRTLAALDERAGFGSNGRFVQLVQQRLAALHFYIPQTGVYDAGTGLALDAYHRLLHWGTYETLDGRTVSYLLNGWGAFPVRYPRNGRHAEGNLSLQLLALVDGSRVQAIYPISSGKPSTPTILGNYRIYRRTPGYLPDGMYYSNFFTGGYAIHGYNPAPDYPASHGCMRVPIVDAISIYDWLRMGDWVDSYY
jgi:L,D-transpeptidase catalytic domain